MAKINSRPLLTMAEKLEALLKERTSEKYARPTADIAGKSGRRSGER